MATQQQTEQPAELGQRVSRLEGGFDEMSPRVGTLQQSVDSLREETHADNAALRTEMQAGDAALRAEMQTGFAELRAEMQAGFAELRAEMNRFKSQVVLLIFGAWGTTVAGMVGAVFAASR